MNEKPQEAGAFYLTLIVSEYYSFGLIFIEKNKIKDCFNSVTKLSHVKYVLLVDFN